MDVDRSGCNATKHGTENAYRQGCRCCDALDDKRTHQKLRAAGLARPAYIDSTGTTRRLQALGAIAHSARELAARLDEREARVHVHRRGEVPRVHVEFAAKVDRLYEQLQGTPGDSEQARAWAKQQEWKPPLLWEDDTIDDPQARPIEDKPSEGKPRTGGPRRIDLDDLRMFEVAGGTAKEYAARVGVDPFSITRAEDRAKQRAAATDAAIQRAREGLEEREAASSWDDDDSPTMQRDATYALGA